MRRMFEDPVFRQATGQRAGRLPRRLVRVNRSAIRPSEVIIASPRRNQGLAVEFAAAPIQVLHDTIAEIASGRFSITGAAQDLGKALRAAGLIEPATAARVPSRGSHATFLGHNAVLIRSSRAAILVDPWVVPATDPTADFQPIPMARLGRLDAIAITHSHPDHFDPGSLLQFDRRLPIFVPRVPEESLLSADLAYRLRELGFDDVHELRWGASSRIGDIELTALPFYGEQPTTGPQLFPETRNWGNCYLVRTPDFTCALIADSGQDRAGRVRDVAREAYLEWGAIDVLFSGYRGWDLYPVQFFESSVRHYLLFVPEEFWDVRQSIMNTVDEAIDTAELWHARYIVPYGDGGAPWYGELGLGPQFDRDGPVDDEWQGFDARPERVLQALATRTMPVPGIRAGSRVQGLLMRPGDSVRRRGTRLTLARMPPPYSWPWKEKAE
jgi:L-ascorbate metabolism protein UlaG (beta-lactamase superfamily)